jgi:hypothetical protein
MAVNFILNRVLQAQTFQVSQSDKYFLFKLRPYEILRRMYNITNLSLAIRNILQHLTAYDYSVNEYMKGARRFTLALSANWIIDITNNEILLTSIKTGNGIRQIWVNPIFLEPNGLYSNIRKEFLKQIRHFSSSLVLYKTTEEILSGLETWVQMPKVKYHKHDSMKHIKEADKALIVMIQCIIEKVPEGHITLGMLFANYLASTKTFKVVKGDNIYKAKLTDGYFFEYSKETKEVNVSN